jgi:hypothetical protein
MKGGTGLFVCLLSGWLRRGCRKKEEEVDDDVAVAVVFGTRAAALFEKGEEGG